MRTLKIQKRKIFLITFIIQLKITYKEKLTKEEENHLLGMVGELNDDDKRELIREVMEEENGSFIVTPNEIDFLIDKLSEVIGNSLNNSLHRQITHF